MNHIDQFGRQQDPHHEVRKSAILRYLEQRIVGKYYQPDEESEELEADVRAFLKQLPPQDKANILYDKLMAYTADQRVHEAQTQSDRSGKSRDVKPFYPDQDLVAEIKVLLEDPNTTKIFSESFSQSHGDQHAYQNSDLQKQWEKVNTGLGQLEGKFKDVEQSLFLKTIDGNAAKSTAKSKAERLARKILSLENDRDEIRSLKSVEAVPENADAAAMFQYETFKQYQEQLRAGFIWLPSRKVIHQQVIGALQNGRWPVLVGEAGTGKSDLADAAAWELTGSAPLEIECESTTSARNLIGEDAIDANGGSYIEYGPLMKAYTGYENSSQKSPSVRHGRIARFDESGRLGPKAYAVIKKARQEGAGGTFYGRPVLPGAAAIWTTNPVGPRYPDRHSVDPAMRRELAEIVVDYPDQSAKSPELYEAMITGLLDQNGHISVAQSELAPGYTNKMLPEDQKRILPDGRIVVGQDELIADPASEKHGTLWRLANAVKAVQDAFVYGNNADGKPHPDGALRVKIGTDNRMDVGSEGEPLTLSSSTITLGEALSWMRGFKERLQKKDASFQVRTFSEWIKVKIHTYLRQVDPADREKVTAIFDHFHLLDADGMVENPRPITAKQIGYLSPRVPRPLHVEMPVAKAAEAPKHPEAEAVKALYETIEVILEDGERIRINKGNAILKTPISDVFEVKVGKKFRMDNTDYQFVGVTEDRGKPVASIVAEPDLHKIVTPEDIERKQFDFDLSTLEKDVKSLCSLTATE